MPYSPSTRTVQDVVRSVQRSFGDESGVQLTNADIFMWINDACDEIVKRNRINKAKASINSVIGQQDYSFTSLNIMQVEAIHFGGQRIPNMSFAEAEEQVIGLDSVPTNGYPVLWYEWAGLFSFYPIPNVVSPIEVFYTAQSAKITAVGNLLPLPDKYFTDIVNFVLLKAYEMDEDPQMSQLKGQQFDASIAAMGEEERSAQNMTYPSITVLDFEV